MKMWYLLGLLPLAFTSGKCRHGRDYIENNDYRIYPPNGEKFNWMKGIVMTHIKYNESDIRVISKLVGVVVILEAIGD